MSYTETDDPNDIGGLAHIKVFDHGMLFNHNMPCCIYTDDQPAVMDCTNGIFTPSWRAQNDGWALVRYDANAGWFSKFLFRLVRNRIFKYIGQDRV